MNATASALRELHRIHRQLRDLNDRRDRGPKQIKASEVTVAHQQAEIDRVEAAAKAARLTVDQKQLQLRSNEDKIAALQGKLNTCKTNREFQALKEQIAADTMANSVLEDEILEAMQKIDDHSPLVEQANAVLAEGQAEFAKISEEVAAQLKTIDADINRATAELAEAESALPADFREAYIRSVRSRGSDAMAEVDGEFCGGCFQQLTPNALNELLMQRVVICGGCGRFLYIPEDRTPGTDA